MVLIVGAVLIALVTAVLFFQPKLQAIHRNIVKSFDNVEHISADALTVIGSSNVVLFDVREQAEFAVSHIEGAIHVDPDISPALFKQKFAESLSNKTAVFYCSVGQRSSELASRVDAVVKDSGGLAAYNLIGGVFQWRNELRELQRNGRPTRLVHPYNRYWGRLIEDRSAISYEPEE